MKIRERKIENKVEWKSSYIDFEELQKDRVKAKLYNQLNEYYKKGISNGWYVLNTYKDDEYIYAELVEVYNGVAYTVE